MSLWISTVAPLLRSIDGTRQLFNEKRLQSAFRLAEELYQGKEHWTEIPLLAHVLGVLQVLAPFEPDEDTVIACLLQHVLAERKMTLLELEEQFGSDVRALVSGVHLLSHVTTRDRRHSIEDLRLMLLSVSDDVRVVLIILSERCYVIEHLALLHTEEKRHLCTDVLNLFAPVAARLGIHSLKQRLESVAFPVVYSADEEMISEQLKQTHTRYGDFLPKASELLATSLKEQGIAAQVYGREKLPYSIFVKMKTKAISQIEKLPDLFGLRVLVESEEQCYRTLGFLHRMGYPVANRFKDYISFPKPNGYRSLHTTLAKVPGIPEEVFIEVQIRTHLMHREAELGIAAHWSYKEGGSTEQTMRRVQLHQVLTQQHALDMGQQTSFADHIFVLTPKGAIIELPEGATPLDFAFQIHTQLGLGFKAARVNGAIVPLDYQLENGDVVEVLTHRVPQPSSEWLQLLKMASSRSRLKRYLYSLHRADYVSRGREILNLELKKLRRGVLDNELTQLRIYGGKVLSFEEREDILMKLGQGSERSGVILARSNLLIPSPITRASRLQRGKEAVIEIDGGLPMPTRFAKCCKPQEGKKEGIVGCITRRGEVTVHRAQCHLLRNINPERKIGVRWNEIPEKKKPRTTATR